MPPAGNWLRFSGSIPSLFVLSPNVAMTNTMSKLASFWRFSVTARSLSSHSLATDHWPLLLPLFSRPPPTPHAPPAGSGRAQTFPHWLLPSTDPRIDKDRPGPDLDERPLYISMSPNRAIASGKSKFSSPLAAAQPWGGMGHLLPATRETWLTRRPTFTGTGRACGKEKSRKPEFSERNGPPTFSHPGNAGGPNVPLGTVLTVHARRLKLHAPRHPRPGMAKSRCRSTYRPWFTGGCIQASRMVVCRVIDLLRSMCEHDERSSFVDGYSWATW